MQRSEKVAQIACRWRDGGANFPFDTFIKILTLDVYIITNGVIWAMPKRKGAFSEMGWLPLYCPHIKSFLGDCFEACVLT